MRLIVGCVVRRWLDFSLVLVSRNIIPVSPVTDADVRNRTVCFWGLFSVVSNQIKLLNKAWSVSPSSCNHKNNDLFRQQTPVAIKASHIRMLVRRLETSWLVLMGLKRHMKLAAGQSGEYGGRGVIGQWGRCASMPLDDHDQRWGHLSWTRCWNQTGCGPANTPLWYSGGSPKKVALSLFTSALSVLMLWLLKCSNSAWQSRWLLLTGFKHVTSGSPISSGEAPGQSALRSDQECKSSVSACLSSHPKPEKFNRLKHFMVYWSRSNGASVSMEQLVTRKWLSHQLRPDPPQHESLSIIDGTFQ